MIYHLTVMFLALTIAWEGYAQKEQQSDGGNPSAQGPETAPPPADSAPAPETAQAPETAPPETAPAPTPEAAPAPEAEAPPPAEEDEEHLPQITQPTGQSTQDDKEIAGADTVPSGQELVHMNFPEPTEIKDIIRAVSLWTGKNVILGRNVSGKVQMISPRKVTKEEAYQMFLSALNVLGLTTVETGKVIKIVQVRSAVKDNLQIYQGASWAPRTDKLITQIVPLKYIDAKQIQTTLSRIVSTNSMIAYEPTNTLIISDTGYKVRRVLAIIELIDVQGQQPQVALVPIKYADAKSIAQKITDILQASQSRAKGAGGSTGGYRAYKISVDERSNSVIIFGPPRTISDVKILVKKFDFPIVDASNQSSIRVRFLDYADAKKLATTLATLTQGSANKTPGRTVGTRSTSSSRGGSSASSEASVADLGGDVKITADESSNSLLITGSRSAYNSLNSLIRKLDQRRAQVYVEADILDISLGNNFKMGTSIFAGSGTENGTKSAYTWEAKNFGSLIIGDQEGASDTEKANAVGVFSEGFTIGILSGTKVNVPGLGAVSPGALINLLKADSNSRVLSSPHLLTSNNEEASITVGQKLFYESSQQSTTVGVGAIPKVEKEDVDLTLKIKPNVSNTGNYVTLTIDLEQNDGGIGRANLPDIKKRKTKQVVTVKNGQTVVISGLVRTSEQEVFKKIPLLGDIPILGWLFRNSTIDKIRQNLVFFLTPHSVYGANDLAAIYEQKVKERDEIMSKAFDTDPDDEFMQKLPTLEDGRYSEQEFDRLERENRERNLEEVRREMMKTGERAPANNGATQTNPDESPVTVPMLEGEGDFGGGGGGGDGGSPANDGGGAEISTPMPDYDGGGAEPPPPSEPPPPPENDGGGGED
ncbi:MAG: type II secretion system secretin GspD [Oligoflexales bacterium]